LSYSSKDLRAWQDAKALAVQTYRVTEAFPKSELFGLTSQMRRAAVSIASNVAEGQGRSSKPDFVRFLRISRGSLLELETQLEIAQELKFGDNCQLSELHEGCYKLLGLLNRLIKSVEAKKQPAQLV
jgi:four helix bundle protein